MKLIINENMEFDLIFAKQTLDMHNRQNLFCKVKVDNNEVKTNNNYVSEMANLFKTITNIQILDGEEIVLNTDRYITGTCEISYAINNLEVNFIFSPYSIA